MKVIIYGAGQWGKYAYWEYVDKNDVVCFCDNNSSLWGQRRVGTNVTVESPKVIEKYPEAVIVVAIQHNNKVLSELKKYDNSIAVYKPLQPVDRLIESMQFRMSEQLMRDLNRERCIWVNDYLDSVIELSELSLVHGSSGLLDYAFLVSTAKKFNAKSYLEIGTYIGDSINCMADYCERCYSVTASDDSPYCMEEFCKESNIPNYSNMLVYKDNIKQFKCIDSHDFSYSEIDDDIDIFFIDADHSYDGVWCDTEKIFDYKKDNAIVVWHDFRNSNYPTALAVKNAIGESAWQNVYCTDKTMCGIYIPECYKKDIVVKPYGFDSDKSAFYTASVRICID